MVERHPVVAALLEDGLKRAYLDADIGEWMHSVVIYASFISAQASRKLALHLM